MAAPFAGDVLGVLRQFSSFRLGSGFLVAFLITNVARFLANSVQVCCAAQQTCTLFAIRYSLSHSDQRCLQLYTRVIKALRNAEPKLAQLYGGLKYRFIYSNTYQIAQHVIIGDLCLSNRCLHLIYLSTPDRKWHPTYSSSTTNTTLLSSIIILATLN